MTIECREGHLSHAAGLADNEQRHLGRHGRRESATVAGAVNVPKLIGHARYRPRSLKDLAHLRTARRGTIDVLRVQSEAIPSVEPQLVEVRGRGVRDRE